MPSLAEVIESEMSPAEKIAILPDELREDALRQICLDLGVEIDELDYTWGFWARPKQIIPEGDDWLNWMLLAGRGFGKTRTGAETIHEWANSGEYKLFHLVGATAADARDIMVLGESGLLATMKPYNRCRWSPTKRRMTWENGAEALVFSADEPQRLRGLQCEAAWADELASWRYEEAWQQLQLGLRLGHMPRTIITTTPRSTQLIKSLVKNPKSYLTTGTTYENASNLADAFLNEITRAMEGTRFGRQEIYAEILEDSELALWNRELLEEHRLRADEAPDNLLKKIVIGIDAAVSFGKESAETGIMVVGQSKKNMCFLLEDASGRYRPEDWAKKVVGLWQHYSDPSNPLGAAEVKVVAEKNQGYELISHTIQVYDDRVPVKLVHASKNKVTRAEPVATAMQRGKVKHVGTFPKLEEQLCTWEPGDAKSPDRMDAYVWALTEMVMGTHITISANIEPNVMTSKNYWKEIDQHQDFTPSGY